MDPLTVSVTIARPREEVFEYLADIANHPEFTDHFLKSWRLTREQSEGRGAGARYRQGGRFDRFGYYDLSLARLDAPFRIVAVGRGGKYNRIKTTGVYTLTPGPGRTTRVEFTNEVEPALLTDRLLEKLGARSWLKRKNRKALRRLRSILEEGEGRGKRATIAGA